MHRRKTFDLPPTSSPSNEGEKIIKNKASVFKGVLLASLSGALYSFTAAIVKEMKNLHPGQLAAYRFIGLLVMSLPQTVKCRENPFGPKGSRLLIVLHGVFGITASFLAFIAFRYLPLGEAVVIILSIPVFVTVAARIFLKEPCGLFQSLTVLLTLIGIIFSAKIPSCLIEKSFVYYDRENIYGLLAALGSLFCCTIRFVVVRKVKHVHHAVIMFNFGWMATAEIVCLTFILGEFHFHRCGLQTFYVLVIGFLGYLGQTFLTMALQCELAGPVSTMRAATDIFMAFMWQTFYFQDIPDSFSVAGAILVGLSVFFVGTSKWVSTLPSESSLYKKLRWTLA